MRDGSFPHQVSLPRDYELIVHESLDDVMTEATRLAAQGAEEGTVVWAHKQTSARTPTGAPWLSGDGDLHTALVLQPEFDIDTSLQLAFVASLSLGAVLSEAVTAMTSLHYRWPNEFLLSHGKVAMLRLAGSPRADRFDWLVLGVDLNIDAVPEAVSYSGASLAVEGGSTMSLDDLLTNYYRYFLRTINRWAESGFSPILEAWLQRVPDLDQYVRLQSPRRKIEGILQQISEDGAAQLRVDDGSVEVLTLREVFGFDEEGQS